MRSIVTRSAQFFALTATILIGESVRSQTIFLEEFDGGASTTGFVIDQANVTDCRWEFAPDSAGAFDFSVDGAGEWPAGPGFDSSFVFLDSDACGGTAVVVNSFLTSAPFNASGGGYQLLSFAHQFQARLASFIRVEAYNGSTWSEVYYQTGTSVGYPNPTTVTSINISDAIAASSVAQIRFQFSAGWDWWWAVDSIEVKTVNCIYPTAVAVTNITTTSGTVTWTDNGSTGYEWVITTGALPDGSNAVASGTGADPNATGLLPTTIYTVFVRSICGGETSGWSDGTPFSTVPNDACTGAIPLAVNNDNLCGTVTAGSVFATTASGIDSCFGSPDDDVWFSFTAIATSHFVSLIDITGSTNDMYFALFSGTCAAPVLVPNSCSDPEISTINGLVVGQSYLLQVFTWTPAPDQTSAFNVCIGTSPIGIGELNAAPAVEVYPNPVSDVLNIRSVAASAVNVRIVDVMGRVVAQQPMACTIPVEQLSLGTYTLIAIDAHGQAVARARFVKQ